MTGFRPVQILLVEDDPGDVVLTKEALAEGKVANTLDVVPDGVEAMRYLRREGEYARASRPDLILLDLNLPKKTGREVLEELQADTGLRTIPVVVLTTSEGEEDISKAYQSNANCYITKPVDLDQFFQVMHMIEDFWLALVQLPPKE
ncbi:MAG: response regulator [Armatimonadia bacterium]|nr:response regulator [Armatimonadia bacterium]